MKAILFGYHTYYPSGPTEDCIEAFRSLEEAKEEMQRLTENEWGSEYEWFEILDIEKQEFTRYNSRKELRETRKIPMKTKLEQALK